MADDAGKGGPPLPPKLDLRKSGVLKTPPASPAEPSAAEAKPAPAAAAAPKPAPAPVAAPQPIKISPPPAPQVGSDDQADEAATMPGLAQPKAAAPAPAAAKKTMIKIDKPMTAQTPDVKPPTVAPAALATPAPETPAAAPVAEVPAPGSKKETTRIPLAAAKPAGGVKDDDRPKTIRIKPATAASSVRIDAGKEEEDARLSAEKRKTSRISLEAVLGGEGEGAAEDGGPKTIRLKRPGDAGAARASASAEPKTVEVTRAAVAADTDGAGEDGPEAPTVRKTVRVKRPSGPAGKASIAVSRPGGQQAAAVATAAAPVQMPKGDRMNFMFPFLTLAAVLILCVTIYMFCSQAFGPNFSLTQYSYANTGPELPWPGKLLATR